MLAYRVSIRARRHLFAALALLCVGIFVLSYKHLQDKNYFAIKTKKKDTPSGHVVAGVANHSVSSLGLEKSPASKKDFNKGHVVPDGILLKNRSISRFIAPMDNQKDGRAPNDGKKMIVSPPTELGRKFNAKGNNSVSIPLQSATLRKSIERQKELYAKAYADIVQRDRQFKDANSNIKRKVTLSKFIKTRMKKVENDNQSNNSIRHKIVNKTMKETRDVFLLFKGNPRSRDSGHGVDILQKLNPGVIRETVPYPATVSLHSQQKGNVVDENKGTDHNVNSTQQNEKAVRPDKCNGCFKVNFEFLTNPVSRCDKSHSDLLLLILISSSPESLADRAAIRQTWGRTCANLTSGVACVFMVAVSNDRQVTRDVMEESNRYKDIVVFSHIDAYLNLTYKTVMGLKWANTFCPRAKYVMKTDQDVYVNTRQIPVMLKAAPRTGFSGGFCWGQSRPTRDAADKWYVSTQMYPKDFLPPMCSGTGYILSKDVVVSILSITDNVPFFHLEDVYVAFCLEELGIVPVKLAGFDNMRTPFQVCEYRYYVMTSHQVSPSEMIDFWEMIDDCPPQELSPLVLYQPLPLP